MHYEALRAQTDQLTAELTAHYAAHLTCRAGCSACCQHHLSVFPVEAEILHVAIQALPVTTQQQLTAQAHAVNKAEAQGLPVACPLLLEERCSVYAARPLICRTQGLPLLFEAEDGVSEVDVCPLNFTAPNATDALTEDKLIPLDALNLQLALANLQACREGGVSDEQSGTRQTISEIILAATAPVLLNP